MITNKWNGYKMGGGGGRQVKLYLDKKGGGGQVKFSPCCRGGTQSCGVFILPSCPNAIFKFHLNPLRIGRTCLQA